MRKSEVLEKLNQYLATKPPAEELLVFLEDELNMRPACNKKGNYAWDPEMIINKKEGGSDV